MTPFSLTAMMYHYVRDPGDAAEAGSGIPGLPLARFESQLDELARRHTPIGWPEVRAAILDEAALPANACLLTFDDGVRDHYLNVFPALRARGLSGLFFALARAPEDGLALGHKLHCLLARLGVERLREAVWRRLTPEAQAAYRQAEAKYQTNGYAGGEAVEVGLFKSVLQRELSAEAEGILSSLIEDHLGAEVEMARSFYLTPDQISEMRAGGLHFGGHSRRHPWFNWVDAAKQADEIEASADWLREVEPGPWAFAYPYGGYSAASPGLLGARGFAAAFTTVEQTQHTNPFFIGRLDGEDFKQAVTSA
jgi:peptidoglycan/xylan/chitin deacetylase (PgdA/CDA1 family)